MGYTADILNNIRYNASPDYQERIPVATRTNISTIGQAFEDYDVLFNEFHEALLNKIGKTIISQAMFKNKLARFKSGEVTSPHDVEEIFIGMAKAEGVYDPDGKNPLGRRRDDNVKVMYHRQNRQDYYAISIGDIDFARTFRSEATLESFIKGKIASVYNADARDEWLCMKELFSSYRELEDPYASGFDFYFFVADTDKERYAVNFIKTLRKAVYDLSFLSSEHNAAHVEIQTDVNNLVLFVHKDVVVECDVERLATAFHQSETDMKVVPTIIVMDDFGTENKAGGVLNNCVAILADKEWFKVWDTKIHMEPQRNAQGLFTNYFYHHHQILSCSPFKNAVAIYEDKD